MREDDLPAWATALLSHVGKSGMALLRLSADEWIEIANSRRGASRFTVARPHANRQGLRTPTAGLVVADEAESTVIRFGIVESIQAVTTLESRLKFVAANPVVPSSERELLRLVTGRSRQARLRSALRSTDSLLSLPPAVSEYLVETLARNETNWAAMRTVARAVGTKTYAGPADLQADAVANALKVFGVAIDDGAGSLELAGPGRSTSLEHVSISEDAVIEHDAKVIDGFELADADLTGRAIFYNADNEVLEVVTANRRPLERVFGVDLIYVNAVKGNVVMVQYKMLERTNRTGKTDWVYRPDRQFRDEVKRMRAFSAEPRHAGEYRINDEAFYLKFVKRDATLGRAPIIMPMDHFERWEQNPDSRGPRGGFRVSYDALSRSYLRQDAFLGLIRAGYIGAYARVASAFTTLIDAILQDGKAVVAAIQAKRQ